MSLAQSADYSMQPEDKTFGLLPQPLDDSFNDLFNQYVNMDRPNGDGNKEKPPAPNLDVLFVQGTPSSGSGYLPITSSHNGNNQPPQPWRKGLWCLQDTALSATEHRFHTGGTVQPSAVSGGSFDLAASPQPQNQSGPRSPSPSTPPVTPNKKSAKDGVVNPNTIHRRELNDRRNLLRKYNSSPTLMRTTNFGKQEMASQALRAPKSQNFTFQGPEKWASFPSPSIERHMAYGDMSHLPLSGHNIPYTSEIGDSAEFPAVRFESTSMLHRSQTISMSQQPANVIGHDQFDTTSGSMIDQGQFNSENLFHSPTATEQQSFSSEQQSFSSWNSDFTSNTPTIPYAPDPQSRGNQTWWASIPTRFSQPYSPSYEPMAHARPIPRRIDTSLANSANHIQADFIPQYSSTSDICSAAEQFFPEQAASPIDVGAGTPYTSLPTSQSLSLDYLIGNSSQKQPSPPLSRSPSVSPTAAVTLPKRSSTAKPTASGSNTRSSNARDGRRTHNRKHSTAGSTPRTPRASASSKNLGARASNGALNVSFVNFTPDDSQKILTGVAPSGSSKTKARREQEAREKRRKLSEAALTAIRRAGGDVDDLSSVFC
ncbi:hypothetical protein FQN54_000472 [Arachnomyces sp. PD_36]|nr:hypothetical protein FQN54_000472 [Arachnomyces sp. PD_36]